MNSDFTLRSGRRVGYSRFGKGARKAFFFHGFPGSSRQGALVARYCEELDLQVIAFDRPGFGASDFDPSWKLSDAAALVGELADHLGIPEFHLMAVSGGSPYALTCAALLPERVLSTHLVGGLGPLQEPPFRSEFPGALHFLMNVASKLPIGALEALIRWRLAKIRSLREGKELAELFFLKGADAQAIAREEVFSVIRLSLEDAFRHGVRGARRELGLFLSPWELDWGSIRCPAVFWHGREDSIVPWRFSELVAGRIAGARFVLLDGEGHYSLPLNHARSILAGML